MENLLAKRPASLHTGAAQRTAASAPLAPHIKHSSPALSTAANPEGPRLPRASRKAPRMLSTPHTPRGPTGPSRGPAQREGKVPQGAAPFALNRTRQPLPKRKEKYWDPPALDLKPPAASRLPCAAPPLDTRAPPADLVDVRRCTYSRCTSLLAIPVETICKDHGGSTPCGAYTPTRPKQMRREVHHQLLGTLGISITARQETGRHIHEHKCDNNR